MYNFEWKSWNIADVAIYLVAILGFVACILGITILEGIF